MEQRRQAQTAKAMSPRRLRTAPQWGAACLGFALGVVGCSERPELVALPPDVWAREGFVQLVPPAPLPSSVAHVGTVEVWAWLPDGATLRSEVVAGRPELAWPAGAVVDRVERDPSDLRRVLDVRGVQFDEDGARMWRLFRPLSGDVDADLIGVTFRSGDELAHDASLAALARAVGEGPRAAAMSEARRERLLSSLVEKSGCDSCHVAGRPESPEALVHRGTDADGLFTPRYVLADTTPVERYGVDRVGQDPYVRLGCGPTDADGCGPDAERSIGTRDVRAGLAAADAATLALCASRAWLKRSLAEADRAALSPAEDSCSKL